MKKTVFLLLVGACFVAGCAKNPDAIAPVSMSSNVYHRLSCQEAMATRNRIDSELVSLSAPTAQRGGRRCGLAFLIGVPMSSLTGGDKEGLIAARKGEKMALDAKLMTCGVRLRRDPACSSGGHWNPRLRIARERDGSNGHRCGAFEVAQRRCPLRFQCRGVVGRGHVADRRVRPRGVEVLDPARDDGAGVVDREEEMLVDIRLPLLFIIPLAFVGGGILARDGTSVTVTRGGLGAHPSRSPGRPRSPGSPR